MMSQHKITTDPAGLAPESEPAQTLRTQPWWRTIVALYLLKKWGNLNNYNINFYSFFPLLKELIVIILAVLVVGLDFAAVLMHRSAPIQKNQRINCDISLDLLL